MADLKYKEPNGELVGGYEIKGEITTAISLQKWIDHLDEEEKHLPIFIYDDQKRYHSLTSIIHELSAAREGMPPSSHFLINTRRCKTSKEVVYELTHEQPIKEIYTCLQRVIVSLANCEELSEYEQEIYARINDVLCKLCEYDDIYTNELLHSKN